MVLGEYREDPEEEGPDDAEEKNNKDNDLPCGRVVAAPQESPVPTIRCGEEEVLDDNGDEKPENDLAVSQRSIEGRNLAWCLTIVFWKSKPHQRTNNPKHDRDGERYSAHLPRVCDWRSFNDASAGLFGEVRAPKPQSNHISLLSPLDHASTEDPRLDRSTAFVTKIQRKEDGTRRGSGSIEGRADILDPTSNMVRSTEMCAANDEESEPIEHERRAEGHHRLESSEYKPPHDRGNQINRGNCIKLRGSLTDFSSQESDLVRIGGNDLAESQEE